MSLCSPNLNIKKLYRRRFTRDGLSQGSYKTLMSLNVLEFEKFFESLESPLIYKKVLERPCFVQLQFVGIF